MTTGDLLGLINQYRTEKLDWTVTVYPRPKRIQDLPLPSSSWQGDFVVRRWIVHDPFMIQGVREYQQGDSMNMINWKATARSAAFQVHNHDFTADHHLYVYLNVEDTSQTWKDINNVELIEQGIDYAASIVNESIGKGIPTAFGCNAVLTDQPEHHTVRIQAGSGPVHLITMFDVMARLRIKRSLPFYVFLEEDIDRQAIRRDFLIITTHVDEQIAVAIDTLRR